MTTADIVKHYQDKGLAGIELRVALARHARLLMPLDADTSRQLMRIRAGGPRASKHRYGFHAVGAAK
ncbi:MAG TPA: hypothetical protein VGK73_06750 [Polyangiaceae bacterium]